VEAKKKRGHDKKQFGNITNGIRKKRIPNISKKILIYFFFLFFLICLIGAGLIHEVGRERLQKEIAEGIVRQLSADYNGFSDISEVANIIKRMQHRVMLGISALLLCVIASMYIFMRYFVKPLDKLGKTVYQMTRGHLDEMVTISPNGEINKIGELVNDLAINLQEILLHVWSHTSQDILLLDRIVKILGSQTRGNDLPPEIRDDLKSVYKDIEDMQSMVKAFDYYHVRLEKEKIVSDDNPDPRMR
jgi:methyl-accepting chemotaxis protein